MRRAAGAALLSLFVFPFVPAAAREISRERYTMGTLLRVTVKGGALPSLDRAAEAVFAEVDRWDKLLSTYKPESEVSRVNAAAPRWEPVSEDTLSALTEALAWARRTEGAFDPTAGALVRLWGFDGDSPRLPSADEVARVRRLVDHRLVETKAGSAPAVRLPLEGMALDFGAIGKGWALDRALDKLKAVPEAEEAVLDFGGQLVFWARGKGSWPAAVRHPGKAGEFLREMDVRRAGSLSTSALSEKFFTAADPRAPDRAGLRRYGHILDPRTGAPAEGMESVTVWAAGAAEADALSTALFVMGPEAGRAYAEARGLAAYFAYNAEGRGLAFAASTKWKEEFDHGPSDQR